MSSNGDRGGVADMLYNGNCVTVGTMLRNNLVQRHIYTVTVQYRSKHLQGRYTWKIKRSLNYILPAQREPS